jgi:hypothetical protein
VPHSRLWEDQARTGTVLYYSVGVGSQANQHGAKSAMGAGSQGIAASSGENNRSCETHHVCISPQEDRGGAAGEVGEGEGEGEEDGVGPTEPAAGCGRLSCFKSIAL